MFFKPRRLQDLEVNRVRLDRIAYAGTISVLFVLAILFASFPTVSAENLQTDYVRYVIVENISTIIEGTIVDNETGAGVGGASVSGEVHSEIVYVNVQTDANGYFKITLPNLSNSIIDYENKWVEVDEASYNAFVGDKKTETTVLGYTICHNQLSQHNLWTGGSLWTGPWVVIGSDNFIVSADQSDNWWVGKEFDYIAGDVSQPSFYNYKKTVTKKITNCSYEYFISLGLDYSKPIYENHTFIFNISAPGYDNRTVTRSFTVKPGKTKNLGQIPINYHPFDLAVSPASGGSRGWKKVVALPLVDADVYENRLIGWVADNANWWRCTHPITITERSGSDLTDYQVSVDVTWNPNMKADFSDLRFTDSDGKTPLDYWRESYTASTSARFWVKVPSIPANATKTIYENYGNPSAASAENGSAVFVFFDTFPGTTIDTSKWAGNTGDASVSGGICTITSGNVHAIYTTTNFVPPVTLRMRHQYAPATQTGDTGIIFGFATPSTLSNVCGGYISSSRNVMILRKAPSAYYKYVSTNWVGGVYNIKKITWDKNTPKVRWFENSTEKTGSPYTSSTCIPTADLPVMFYYAYNGYHYIDWVTVSKYVDPEPTANIGAEQAVPGPPIKPVYDWVFVGSRRISLSDYENPPANTQYRNGFRVYTSSGYQEPIKPEDYVYVLENWDNLTATTVTVTPRNGWTGIAALSAGHADNELIGYDVQYYAGSWTYVPGAGPRFVIIDGGSARVSPAYYFWLVPKNILCYQEGNLWSEDLLFPPDDMLDAVRPSAPMSPVWALDNGASAYFENSVLVIDSQSPVSTSLVLRPNSYSSLSKVTVDAYASYNGTFRRVKSENHALGLSTDNEPMFRLDVTASSYYFNAVSSATVNVSLTSINGFSGYIRVCKMPSYDNVSLTGLPDNVYLPQNGTATLPATMYFPLKNGTYDYFIWVNAFGGGEYTYDGKYFRVVGYSSSPNPAPDISPSVNPTTATLLPGQTTTATVTVKRINNYDKPIKLTASGELPGVSVEFSPQHSPYDGNPHTEDFVSTMTVRTNQSAPPGTYTIAIGATGENASGGSFTRTCEFKLTVLPLPQPDFNVSVSPSYVKINASSLFGGSTQLTVSVHGTNGFNKLVSLSWSGYREDPLWGRVYCGAGRVPPGFESVSDYLYVSFNPSVINPESRSIMTASVPNRPSPRTFYVTVYGSADGKERTATTIIDN